MSNPIAVRDTSHPFSVPRIADLHFPAQVHRHSRGVSRGVVTSRLEKLRDGSVERERSSGGLAQKRIRSQDVRTQRQGRKKRRRKRKAPGQRQEEARREGGGRRRAWQALL
eukprot:2305318-Rhodomonas_salina.1